MLYSTTLAGIILGNQTGHPMTGVKPWTFSEEFCHPAGRRLGWVSADPWPLVLADQRPDEGRSCPWEESPAALVPESHAPILRNCRDKHNLFISCTRPWITCSHPEELQTNICSCFREHMSSDELHCSMCCTMTNYTVLHAAPWLTVLCAAPWLITVRCAAPWLITVLCAAPWLITLSVVLQHD